MSLAEKTVNDPSPWTVGRLLDWTAGHFAKLGLDSPRLDAEVLLGHALSCPRIQLYAHYDVEVGDADRTRFRELVRRRGDRAPIAQLVGEREFYSLAFHVGADVLIPRPETEILAGEAIRRARENGARTFLDLGTGSGALAVTIAKRVPESNVVAVDFSEAALAVARRNAARHEVAARIEFLQGDWFEPVAGRTFDVVVSNPPYVADAEWEALDPEVRRHEPKLALVGGVDGLNAVRRIVAAAPPFVAPGGMLAIEIGAGQAEAGLELLRDRPEWEAPIVLKDFAKLPRVLRAFRPGGAPAAPPDAETGQDAAAAGE
ncbi:MAG TPA: peptide chain release factor N(5)-glutamine methyltransferase [Planctomycetia bacterium]|nr:peptide chain release factor N(5)-glutamine methyltransferase [Planctomycetia bacterium]